MLSSHAASNSGVVRAPLIVNAAIAWRIILAIDPVFGLLWYSGLSTNQKTFGWSIVILAVVGIIALTTELILTTFNGPRMKKIAANMV